MGMSGLSAMKSNAACSRDESISDGVVPFTPAPKITTHCASSARPSVCAPRITSDSRYPNATRPRHTSASRTRFPHFAHACSLYCSSIAKTIKSAVRHQNSSPAKRTPGTARHIAPSTAQTAAAVHSLFCLFMVCSHSPACSASVSHFSISSLSFCSAASFSL